ncbi:DNA polymerase III subunit delta [Anaerovibrio sp.]|uniref:DNA polymerase III subunit delta n=1 Tax=Anaerovibrio sp. TaxID=1872532 RepID=UPI003F17C75A
MKYGELMAGLRKGSPGHLYLLAGEEGYFIEKAKERLLQCFFPDGYQKEDVQVLEDGVSLSEIMEAVETVPFFLDKNVIIVKAAGLFKDKKADGEEKSGGKSGGAEERFFALLKNMPEFSYVIFELQGKPDKRKKLYKAISSAGQVMEAEPIRASNAGDWLQGKLQELNKEMDRQAYEYFIGAISSMQTVNLSFLSKELEKLALFLGASRRRISREQLLQVFSDVPEISSFAMLNAIGDRNTAKALQLFKRQLDNGVYFVLIVGMLARQVRLWWLAQELQSQGVRGRALASRLGQPPFIAEKTGREAATFPPGALRKALLALSDADYGLKTGQADIVELEAIIISLGNREACTL